MPGAAPPDPRVAILGRERLEDRLEPPARRLGSAHHEAIAGREPPDPARSARVDEMDLALGEPRRAPHGVLVVGISAVDDRVIRPEQGSQVAEDLLGRLSRGNHDPDRARSLLHSLDQIRRARCSRSALALGLADGLRGAVPRDDPMRSIEQAEDHVLPHPPEPNEPEFHQSLPWGLDQRRWRRATERSRITAIISSKEAANDLTPSSSS